VVRAGARAHPPRRGVLRDALRLELGRRGARGRRAGCRVPGLDGGPAHQRQVLDGRVRRRGPAPEADGARGPVPLRRGGHE
jgi:hypothetical protein